MASIRLHLSSASFVPMSSVYKLNIFATYYKYPCHCQQPSAFSNKQPGFIIKTEGEIQQSFGPASVPVNDSRTRRQLRPPAPHIGPAWRRGPLPEHSRHRRNHHHRHQLGLSPPPPPPASPPPPSPSSEIGGRPRGSLPALATVAPSD